MGEVGDGEWKRDEAWGAISRGSADPYGWSAPPSPSPSPSTSPSPESEREPEPEPDLPRRGGLYGAPVAARVAAFGQGGLTILTSPVGGGTVLSGRYRLDEKIGEGGMSVVWSGHDTVLDRPVAVKILANASYEHSILNEAKAAASLSHPHVASVFDFGEFVDTGGTRVPFVVMELLRGKSMAQRLRAGPMDAAAALRLCAQVAGALASAHERGIVHRDIKPGNIMLTASGAKVFDFGIAASVGQSDQDADLPIVGTAAYLAPERLAGEPVTAASDVYALALLLYRALTNELPWSVETITDMISAHVYWEPKRLPALPGVPETVRDLAQRCLTKVPSARPSARSAAIVLAAAAGITASIDDDGPTSGVSLRPLPPAPPGRRRRVVLALIALAAVIALIPVAAAWSRSGSNSGATAAPPTSTVDTSGPGLTPTVPPVTGTQPAGPATPSAAATGPGGQPPATGTTPGTEPSTTVETTAPAPSESPSGQTRFSAPGGSVYAGCIGTQAVLLKWRPMDGWTVRRVEAGPANQVQAVFQRPGDTSGIRVRCPAGTPIAQILVNPA